MKLSWRLKIIIKRNSLCGQGAKVTNYIVDKAVPDFGDAFSHKVWKILVKNYATILKGSLASTQFWLIHWV